MASEARYNRCKAFLVENHGLHKTMTKYASAMRGLTPQRHSHALRITTLALIVLGITYAVLSSKGISLQELPGRIKQLFHTQVGWKAGVIMGSIGLLLAGSSLIIYKVSRNKGKFWGNAHYQPVVLHQATIPGKEKVYWPHRSNFPQQLVDTSLLNKDGTGTTNSVQRKVCVEHEIISTSAVAVSPLIAAGSVIYNIVRAVTIPFYILGRMAQEKRTGDPIYPKERKFAWKDIPKQVGLSIFWAARAPFYATAYFFSALYSFIDPMGGRKLGQLVSHDWMEGVDRCQSVWNWDAVDRFKWEGGGGPKKLGQQAYFWTGCWMPWATVEMKKGKITRAYYPGELFEYDVYYREEAGQRVPDLYGLPDIEAPIDQVADALPLGHYRYVINGENTTLVAHATRRSDGQRVQLQCEVVGERPTTPHKPSKKEVVALPNTIDTFLRGATVRVLEKGSGRVLRLSNEKADDLEKVRPANPGEYRFVQQGDTLWRLTRNDAKKITVTTQLDKKIDPLQLKSEKGVKDRALQLELGQWGHVTVESTTYHIAHIQDEWGQHLYITKEMVTRDPKKKDLGDINSYLAEVIKASRTKTTDLFGAETLESIIYRKSIHIEVRELQELQ